MHHDKVCGFIVAAFKSTYNFDYWIELEIVSSDLWLQITHTHTITSSFMIIIEVQKM